MGYMDGSSYRDIQHFFALYRGMWCLGFRGYGLGIKGFRVQGFVF